MNAARCSNASGSEPNSALHNNNNTSDHVVAIFKCICLLIAPAIIILAIANPEIIPLALLAVGLSMIIGVSFAMTGFATFMYLPRPKRAQTVDGCSFRDSCQTTAKVESQPITRTEPGYYDENTPPYQPGAYPEDPYELRTI
jgi:hypothetical protein